jgi:predicted nucleic acid-binding protein
MVLVDTSVWIEHLRIGNAQLAHLLNTAQVSMHPMIVGELACGNLANRMQLLNLLQNLEQVAEASHSEVMYLLEAHKLMGRGVGFVDLHLLSSSLLSANTTLWTLDKRLGMLASELKVNFLNH